MPRSSFNKKNGGSGSGSNASKTGGASAPNPKGGARVPTHDAPFNPAEGSTTAIHLPTRNVGQAKYAGQLACCLGVAVSVLQAGFVYLNLAFNGAEAAWIKDCPRRREEEATSRDYYKSNIRAEILKTERFKALESRVDPSDKLLLQYALASALLPHKLPSRALSALACNPSIIDLFMSSPCATDDDILIRMEALRGTSHGPMTLPSTSEAAMVPHCYNLDTDADAADFESMVAERDRIEYEADCHALDMPTLHLCSLAPEPEPSAAAESSLESLLTEPEPSAAAESSLESFFPEPAAAAALLVDTTYNAPAHPMMPPMGTYYYPHAPPMMAMGYVPPPPMATDLDIYIAYLKYAIVGACQMTAAAPAPNFG